MSGLINSERQDLRGDQLDGQTRSTFDWVGLLGEQFIDLQTGDINNVGPGFITAIEAIAGVTVIPDSIDKSFGTPPVIGDVKVGRCSNYQQAEDLGLVIEKGVARPGVIYFLESPATGRIGAIRGIIDIWKSANFRFVWIRGPWWDFMQKP